MSKELTCSECIKIESIHDTPYWMDRLSYHIDLCCADHDSPDYPRERWGHRGDPLTHMTNCVALHIRTGVVQNLERLILKGVPEFDVEPLTPAHPFFCIIHDAVYGTVSFMNEPFTRSPPPRRTPDEISPSPEPSPVSLTAPRMTAPSPEPSPVSLTAPEAIFLIKHWDTLPWRLQGWSARNYAPVFLVSHWDEPETPPRGPSRAARRPSRPSMPQSEFELLTLQFLRGMKIKEMHGAIRKSREALPTKPHSRRNSPASIFELQLISDPSPCVFELNLLINP